MELAGTMDVRRRVLDLAREEGFAMVRFAPAAPLLAAREAAQTALAAGHVDGMNWISSEWLHRSTDPRQFLQGARSVILFALPYGGEPNQSADDGLARGRIARYARGRDYHRVFEKKLRRIARTLREEFSAEARATVDYGPLLERPLAAASGMGWLGKSTMLLVPGVGPWVLLGAIATTLELEPDEPLKKTCGSCTRCIVACPTGAISPEGHVLDARLCISYHTIENRGPIPRDLRPQFGDWIFGCDDCLESCPVGSGSHAGYPDFEPRSSEDTRPALAPLLALDAAAFEERFRGRPIMRAKRDGFLRNVCIALGNVGAVDDFVALVTALADPSPLVRGHAAWAIGALGRRLGLDDGAARALEQSAAVEQDPWVLEEVRLAQAELGLSHLQEEMPHGHR
jgi:epoxyqueuosine reductase